MFTMIIHKKRKRLPTKNQKSVFLHASAVCISERAFVFLGHSNAGKTTLSKILSQRYSLIADDKVLAYKKKDGTWWIYGVNNGYIAWREKISDFSLTEYPLHSIFRIFKDKKFRLISVSAREACKYLTDAIFENDFQRNKADIKTAKIWFKAAKDISKKSKNWRLTFPKNETIIKKISYMFEMNNGKKFKVGENEKNEV